jgi:glucose/arabinose dehydrogenase
LQRIAPTIIAVVLLAGVSVASAGSTTQPTGRAGRATAAFVAQAALPDVQDDIVVSGLQQPTSMAFLPDGRFFVAEKSGIVKLFRSVEDPVGTIFADLRTSVHNFWDRGLLGIAVPHDFARRPYLYLLYTYDAVPGGAAPRWGTAGVSGDGCPTPPGPTAAGCVVQGRLSRIKVSGNRAAGGEKVLLTGWCQQFPSHSVGGIEFGPGDALYVSAGEGASFNEVDYGQIGNPCGDPPGGVMAPPAAAGGALRAQDLQTRQDPQGLSGTVLRLNPDTGHGLSDNPLASDKDANARRIIATGLRNPFRLMVGPGTDELYVGDVGWNSVEEINRIGDVDDAAIENFGWPCYEGVGVQQAYSAAGLDVCRGLIGEANAQRPAFGYAHRTPVVAGESCGTGSSSISGLAVPGAGTSYPAPFDTSLFFTDYARGCIWAVPRAPAGGWAFDQTTTFLDSAASPVDLTAGPGGDLFYADLDGGSIHRVRMNQAQPVTCPIGQWKAEYFTNPTLSGGPTVTRCESAIDNSWGLGAPVTGVGPDNFSVRWTGTFAFDAGPHRFTALTDDGMRASIDGTPLFDGWLDQAATQYTADRTLVSGQHRLQVEYYDHGFDAVARFAWTGSNGTPTPTIAAPTSSTTWAVGDVISYSGSARDPEEGSLPPTSLTWSLVLHHCPVTAACHTHVISTTAGQAQGSFVAPDHEYPSYLELVLTATDSRGASGSTKVRLDPRTVGLSFDTAPSGMQVAVGSSVRSTPFTTTVIVGSRQSLAAPTPQTLGTTTFDFTSWSDGGSRTHEITAPAAPSAYIATFAPRPQACAPGQFTASYYRDVTLAGPPLLTRCESAIDYDWGTAAPAAELSADYFSVRWTSTTTLAAGNHRFTATADDGIRVLVDGNVVIDGWKDQEPTTYTAVATLAAGSHSITVEYYERGGGAVARFNMTSTP